MIHQINDDYNFNSGDVFAGTISADDINLLKKCDSAADFTHIVTWKNTIDITDKSSKIIKMIKDKSLPFVTS